MASPELPGPPSGLPFIDEHQITIAAPRDQVWAALRRWSDSLGLAPSHPLAALLGTEPRSGFELVHHLPQRSLGFAGRHRFSRYLLAFDLTDLPGGRTQVSARSHAEFPRLRGRAYRALVVGTGAHVVAVGRMLRAIRRESLIR
jgi:hypothetical protein